MQPSRRAFLFGRQTPRTSWDAFLSRLERVVRGQVSHLGVAGMAHARLTPVDREDVRQARALCVEYGVGLRLDRASAMRDGDQPVLDMDPSHFSTLTRVAQAGEWLAEPGCRLAELVAAGLPQFCNAPPEWSLAEWLSADHGWPAGGTAASGVVGVELLLSDGTAEMLGAFGAADQRPLQTATVQRLVPALFQLSASVDGMACREARHWPASYRLDALQPQAPATVNLAQLILGHGGELAWVESVTLIPGEPAGAGVEAEPPEPVAAAARRLRIRMKEAFDPVALYVA